MKFLDRHLQYLLVGVVLGVAVMPGVLWSLRERFAIDLTGIADARLTDYYRAFYSGLEEPLAWLWIVLPYGLFIMLRTLLLPRAATGERALTRAASRGSIRDVKNLIETGADVNAIGRSGQTPLHNASYECKPEVVSMLLRSGADLDACDVETGIRPLHIAAEKGCLQACELLIRHGAEINVQTREGATALHLAARAGHAEVVLLLLKYLANHTLQDAQGHTATHYAQQAGHRDIVKHIEQHRQSEWPYLHMSNR
jgi:hypothetical protein